MHLMKKMNFLYVLAFLFLFIECSPKQAKNEVSNSKYCANELSLLSVSDSLKKIKIAYHLEEKQLLSSIEEKLGDDVCGELVSFGLILKSEDVVKVQYRKMCDDGMILCGKRYWNAKMLLNEEGLLLIDYELSSIDSVKHWLHQNLLNGKGVKFKETSLKWEAKTPKDSIEKTFTAIMDGYLLKYEDLSQQFFSKKICDLETSQINILKEKLSFKLQLELEELIIILPPPPIEVIEE